MINKTKIKFCGLTSYDEVAFAYEKNPYQSKHLGILKYSVPDFIQNSPELMSKIKKIDLDSIENFSKGNFEIIMKKKWSKIKKKI